MLRFAANITMLFKEVPFADRFQAAADAGFKAVEFLWQTEVEPARLALLARQAGVQVVLFNTDAGNMAAGSRGLLNDPAQRDYRLQNLNVALALARELRCPRIHPLLGNRRPGVAYDTQLADVANALKEMAVLADVAGVGLSAEVLNSFDHPNYLVTNTAQMLQLLALVDSPSVKYQYDIYHLQRMEGNIIHTLRQHIGRIGHIQIGDSPGRNQPGTGELHFRHIFAELEALHYDGYIGLEYNPKGTTMDALKWLPRDGRAGCTSADLLL